MARNKKMKNSLKKPEKRVDRAEVCCNNEFDMSEIRDAILKQMRKSGLTIYRVAQLVQDKIPQRTVYAFLTGEQDAVTEKAEIIMAAVGLKITSIAKGKKKKRR
jgi:hypothetical protein